MAVTLVDRSGRRIDLARRAVRVLGLDNVEVRQADVDHLQGAWDVVTFRASLPVPAAAAAFARIGAPSGVGLLGLSRQADPPHVPDPPAGIAFTVADVAEGRLDSPFWLLTMRRSS